VLTALGDADVKLAGYRLEIDDFITKPFDNDELESRLQAVLANRRRAAEHVRRGLAGQDEPTAPSPAPSVAASRKFLEKLDRVLLAGIADDRFDLTAIAAQFAISKRQFQRRLKDACGLTFTAYRTALRLKIARDQLTAGKPVTQIAMDLGFSSPTYFAQEFKKAHGVTPTEWRRGGGEQSGP